MFGTFVLFIRRFDQPTKQLKRSCAVNNASLQYQYSKDGYCTVFINNIPIATEHGFSKFLARWEASKAALQFLRKKFPTVEILHTDTVVYTPKQVPNEDEETFLDRELSTLKDNPTFDAALFTNVSKELLTTKAFKLGYQTFERDDGSLIVNRPQNIYELYWYLREKGDNCKYRIINKNEQL